MPAQSAWLTPNPSKGAPMELTRGTYRTKLAGQVERAKKQLARIQVSAKATMGMVMQSVEVSGAAFGMAYANQRWGKGEFKLFGMPADLLAGVGIHAVALLGDGLGEYSDHAHNVADGVIAGYAARKGAEIGTAHADGSTGWLPAQNAMGGPTTGWIPADNRQPTSGGAGWIPAEAARPRAA